MAKALLSYLQDCGIEIKNTKAEPCRALQTLFWDIFVAITLIEESWNPLLSLVPC